MDWIAPERAYNIARDWNMAQGFSNPADQTVMIRRDINLRKVSIENSSPDQCVGCAITTYYEGPLPTPQFILQPGEVKYIGINTIGGPMQFLFYMDVKSGKQMGTPCPFRTDCNQFVLRQGVNRWFVQTFQTAGFRG
jgi:hypothetical protein